METKSSPRPVHLQGEIVRLLVLATPAEGGVGRTYVLARDHAPIELRRGSTRSRAIGLDDAEVSRLHAVLELDDTKCWRLRDLGSRNGSFVNGARIGQQRLVDGDVLRLGAHLLLVQHLDGAACRRLVESRLPQSDRLIGKSPVMLALHDQLHAAAAARLPTLVLGESGVGKELLAETLHAAWGGGPFVPVNCAAMPDSLAESELFGHARGAFTGAGGASAGLFGAADGGTLFLDEVGELSPLVQAKLLRALATGEVRAVGEQRARRVNACVIAATNRDLAASIAQGEFRDDLYARLAGSVVHAPPLRVRRDDIPDLVRHFLAEAASDVAVDALEALLLHDWPRNVRELEHVVRAALPAARAAGCLTLEHLPPSFKRPFDAREHTGERLGSESWRELLGVRRDAAPTADELRRVLAHFRGNVSRVAAFFGRERTQIYRWAELLAVDIVDARGAAERSEGGEQPGRQGRPRA
jgi:DNA-binding NtrC family response regulator